MKPYIDCGSIKVDKLERNPADYSSAVDILDLVLNLPLAAIRFQQLDFRLVLSNKFQIKHLLVQVNALT